TIATKDDTEHRRRMGARGGERSEISVSSAHLHAETSRTRPVLFVQDRWPGGNQHIFCLREGRLGEDVTIGAEVERVPIVALQRYGRRLSVVLDRPRQKRCDFQIVEKAYKTPDPEGPATYEQIFWFTQT